MVTVPAPPAGSAITAAADGVGVTLSWPLPRPVTGRFGAAWVGVWLVGWAIGWLVAASALAAGKGNSGLAGWFAFWTVAGCAAFWTLRRLFRPALLASVRLESETLRHEPGRPPYFLGGPLDAWGARGLTGFDGARTAPPRAKLAGATEVGRAELRDLVLDCAYGRQRLCLVRAADRLEIGPTLGDLDRLWLADALKRWLAVKPPHPAAGETP